MEYANSFKGTAMYALRLWENDKKHFHNTPPGASADFLAGRLQAYAAIVQHIAGINPDENEIEARHIIDMMPS